MKILIFLFPILAICKPLLVNSELDTTTGYIGDIIKWTIKVEGNDKRELKFPLLNEINEPMNINNHQLLYDETTRELNGIEFELTVLDTGNFMTPIYAIKIMNNDKVEYEFVVDPIEFKIISILTSIDQVDFKEMKGPVPVKGLIPLKEILYCLSLASLLLGIIWTWGQRIKPHYWKLDYSVFESPMERASRRLSELNTSMLTKEYYSTLSHIIREYIETKYFIRTLEMTTEEIESTSDILNIEEKYVTKIINILYDSDKVKYAREVPKSEKMIEDKKKIETIINHI